MSVINVTQKTEFEEQVLHSSKVVVVDFWAEWCPPCKAMAPILQQLAEKYDTNIDVVKVDVEASVDNQQLAADHGVQGIPNMQIYKDGTVVDQLVGMRSLDILEDDIKKHL